MSGIAARVKPLDWNKVKSVLAKEDFLAVNEQRARHMELTRVLSTTIPSLDFAQYKSVLENQSLVSEVEKATTSFKPATANVSPILSSLKEQRVQALQRAKETVDQVTQTVSGFKADLDGIKNIQHHEDISADKVYHAAPGLEDVYHKRLADGKVYHEEHNFGEKFIG